MTDTSIRFPPATLSSKLSTKMLRKTSDHVDWMEPSFVYWPSDVNESDSESECYTITTSSTSGKHNIYQFYRQQQALHQPITHIQTISPIESISSREFISSRESISPIQTISPIQSIIDIQPQKKTKKKRLVLIKQLMMKMRDAAERPFQSIDHHF